MKLLIKKLDANAKLPVYGSEHAAGFDIHANLGWNGAKTLYPRKRMMVPTGLAFAVPAGFYLRIAPRSGLAAKYGIDVFAGVIDSDYRGEVGVILYNAGDEEFTIRHGDRICQGILEQIATGVTIEEADDLTDTERGAGGFGSTGV